MPMCTEASNHPVVLCIPNTVPNHYLLTLLGADVDGPRCWFPCLDHTVASCIFELELFLIDTSGTDVDSGAVYPLIPLFSGETLSKQNPGGTFVAVWLELYFMCIEDGERVYA